MSLHRTRAPTVESHAAQKDWRGTGSVVLAGGGRRWAPLPRSWTAAVRAVTGLPDAPDDGGTDPPIPIGGPQPDGARTGHSDEAAGSPPLVNRASVGAGQADNEDRTGSLR
jgi:hypothetical protein